MTFFNPKHDSWIYRLYKQKTMKKTLAEFIYELELLKQEYIKRGYRDYNTADRQSYGQFVELSQILFELKKIDN